MAVQKVNIGAAPNDGSGDSLRLAFQKVNNNADELSSALELAEGALPSADATPEFIRDSLQTLTGDNRTNVSAIKGAASLSESSLGVFKVASQGGVEIAAQRVGRSGAVVTDFASIGSGNNQWRIFDGGGTIVSTPNTNGLGASDVLYTPGSMSSRIEKVFSTPFRIYGGTLMTIVLKIPPAAITATPNINIRLSSVGSPGGTSNLNFTWLNAYFKADGEIVLNIRAAEDGTQEYASGATWATVGGEAWGNDFNYMMITLNGLSGIPVQFSGVIIGAKQVPVVAWSFDGAPPGISNTLAKVFAEYGWSATVFGDGNVAATDAPTFKMLRDVYGWSVGSMGWDHKSWVTAIASNPNIVAQDLALAQAAYTGNGLGEIQYVGCSLNQTNAAVDAALEEFGIKARRALGNDIWQQTHIQGMMKLGFSQHLGRNYDTGSANGQLKNRFAAYTTQGSIASDFTHNESINPATWTLGGDLNQLYQICDDIQSRGFKVISYDQMIDYATGKTFI